MRLKRVIRHETKIIGNAEEIIKEIQSLTANSNRLDTCLTSGGMKYSHKYFFEIKKKLLDKQRKGEHEGLRYLTSINNENVKLAKLYLDFGIQIRHLDNAPPLSFGVSDKQIAFTIEKMERGKVVQSLLISNEPQYLKHFTSFFLELWKKGVNARERIRELEEGIEPTTIKIIKSPKDSVTLSGDLVKSAKHEVLRIYPSIGQFHRQIRMGVLDLFKDALDRGINIKILVPANVGQMKQIMNEAQPALPRLEVRSLESSLRTEMGILVVDRKKSVIIELKDDAKTSYYDAAGLAAYSDSKPIAVSYASIFEALWKLEELYEQLKTYNAMQREFINIAAHELRTPVQPILGLSQVLLSENRTKEDSMELIRTICRNAERLNRLVEDVLDVTRIESQTLRLRMERFGLNDLINGVVSEYKTEIERAQSCKKIIFTSQADVSIEGDRERLSQVLSNLLSNAVKFSEEGSTITISCERALDKDVIISVSDTGTGIDSRIFPRLFTKFASRSERGGTGLGLYISKSIIEAHGGQIWGKNNSDGRGATFVFRLPLTT